MTQNVVIKGTDTPVVITFSFTGEFATGGLSNFTDIQVGVGDEQYTLLLNPNEVVVTGTTELRLLLGTETALTEGRYRLTIVGVSPTYDDGYVLSGGCRNPLSIFIKEPS